MSAPEAGTPAAAEAAASPGRPPTATTPRSAGRRSIDGGARRSIDGGRARHRHTVEVPENAEAHEGLVVSRQEKFGFIKSSTHEGRYFFHVNDSDGQAVYGSTVSFVVARDLTTGKDVAYRVNTLAAPMGGTPPPAGGAGAGATPPGAARGVRSGTPDRAAGGVAAAEGSAFYRQGSVPAAGEAAGAADSSAAAALGPAPGGAPGLQQQQQQQHFQQQQHPQQRGPGGGHPNQQGGAQQYGQYNRRGGGGGHFQPGPGQGGPEGGPFGGYNNNSNQGQGQGQGQGQQPYGQPYGHFAHRQPSPASSQRDWRVREPPAPSPPSAEAPTDPTLAAAHFPPLGAPADAAPAPRYRGTVAQPARAARHHGMDDGLLLYIDEQGTQQQARYGNYRLGEGTQRLEPGDVVEFELVSFPGAGGGHRKMANDVRFLSKSLLPSPSLEAAVAANEAGDPLGGRQLGRVALLKKEFGFIRQMDRPGDMFFHFSQLEGWSSDDVKVGDDVEYTVRRDRDGTKLSAVQIRRAPQGAVVFETVSEELHRGVILERPQLGKQYLGSSGVVEYVPPGEGGDAAALLLAGGEAAIPGMPGPGKARLPFSPQDVAQGSGSLRVGDHVCFRVLTNLQAVKAAAQATVPGAAAYAGRRAVEVTFVRYAGTVVQVNKERQFGFISYGEDQLLPPGPLHAPTPAEAEAGESGAATAEPSLVSEPTMPTAEPSAAAEAAPAADAPTPAAAEAAPVAEAAAAAAEEEEAKPAADAKPAPEAAAASAEGAGEAPAPAAAGEDKAAAAEQAKAAAKKTRIFFHFKEVTGQHILKPGDEVVFVLHTNLKSGELNAQRVRRTKEGPELPPAPEPAPRPTPVPAVNPNRNKYSGNLSSGGYKQPKIAKGPDGTAGFDFPRPGAVVPPLPGLEPKPEPGPEAEEAEGEAAAEGMEVEAPPAAAPAAAAALAAAAPSPVPGLVAPPAVAPGLSLAQAEAKQAHAAAAKHVADAVPVAGVGAAAGPVMSPTLSGSWQGSTPFSSLAAMSLTDAAVVEQSLPGLSTHLSAHLSAEAPAFVPTAGPGEGSDAGDV
ncbi:Cold shock domain-containing [Micractinium conductrix]|uniref:Cold shock domain-containing n=1 Tax=Micractinium conductrix TaxID=554055 RepID=A0A2P6VD60_9CHLO|nr:Cold shock domain-containing [Micractinium conductrix]|eukprot:PSC71991.1 Cold shock domain-containing [Micractinium conductrix]